MLIGADLVYNAPAVAVLAAVLSLVLHSNPDCQVLLAHCSRHVEVDAQLFDALRLLGVHLMPAAVSDKDKRVTLYRRKND